MQAAHRKGEWGSKGPEVFRGPGVSLQGEEEEGAQPERRAGRARVVAEEEVSGGEQVITTSPDRHSRKTSKGEFIFHEYIVRFLPRSRQPAQETYSLPVLVFCASESGVIRFY